MKQGITFDLKNFKHVGSDKNTTTLRHKLGHTITLAHQHLSKEAQEQLAAMANNDLTPQQKAEKDQMTQQMNRGGVVPDMPGGGPFKDGGIVSRKRPDMPEGAVDIPNTDAVPFKKGGKVLREDQSRQPMNDMINYYEGGKTRKMMAEGGDTDSDNSDDSDSSDQQSSAQPPAININLNGAQPQNQSVDPQLAAQQQQQQAAAAPQPQQPAQQQPGFLQKLEAAAPSLVNPNGYLAKGIGAIENFRNKMKGDVDTYNSLPNTLTPQQKNAIVRDTDSTLANMPQNQTSGGGTQTGNTQLPTDQMAPGAPVAVQPASGDNTAPPDDNTTNSASQPTQTPNQGGAPRAAASAPTIGQLAQQQANNPQNQMPSDPTKMTDAQIAMLTPDQYRDALSKQMITDTQAFQHDLQNQHITPDTYAKLFGKQDTAGKALSIIGMMAGAMGSTMTGHPDVNPFFKMWDNMIDKDMKAQQESATNAQNFLSIQNHLLEQKAYATNQYAQANLARTNAEVTAYPMTRAKTNIVALHDAIQQINKLPPGPQKTSQLTAIGQVASHLNLQNANLMDLAAAAAANKMTLNGASIMGSALTNSNTPQGVAMSADPGAKLQQLIEGDKDHTIMSEQDKTNATNELGTVAGLNAIRNDMLGVINRIQNNRMFYLTHPDALKSERKTFAAAQEKAIAGRFNKDASYSQMESAVAGLLSAPATFQVNTANVNRLYNDEVVQHSPTLMRLRSTGLLPNYLNYTGGVRNDEGVLPSSSPQAPQKTATNKQTGQRLYQDPQTGQWKPLNGTK